MAFRKRRRRHVAREHRSFLLAFAGAVLGSLVTFAAMQVASSDDSRPVQRPSARTAQTMRESFDATMLSKTTEPPRRHPIRVDVAPPPMMPVIDRTPPAMNPTFL